MVSPAFGFSVGDFIAGTKLLISLFRAFKEAGGASSKYAAEVSFLNSLNATLQHLDSYIGKNSQNNLSQGVEGLVKVIRGPLDEFKAFLDKYESSLSESSTKAALGKAPKTIRFTVKEISGKVQSLRTQIEQPLQAVNSLLSLHIINLLEKLPDNMFNPTNCAQLVEAIKLANIPAELDKQIQALQHDAAKHKIEQDEQLQTIKALRSDLGEKIAKLQEAVDGLRDDEPGTSDLHASPMEASQTGEDKLTAALQSQTDKLSETVKEHERLIVALKAFLDDKTSNAPTTKSNSAPESTSTLAHRGDGGNENDRIYVQADGSEQKKHPLGFSWPSATLPTAYLALTLLSGVASTVAAVSVNRAPRPNYGQYAVMGVQSSYLPTKDFYSPQVSRGPRPSLEQTTRVPDRPLDTPAPVTTASTQQNISTYSPNTSSTRERPSEETRQERVSQWLQGFGTRQSASSELGSIVKHDTPARSQPKPNGGGGFGEGFGGGLGEAFRRGTGGGTGGSGNRISKLDVSSESSSDSRGGGGGGGYWGGGGGGYSSDSDSS